MGIILAIALMPSIGEALNASKIQMAALLCIFPKVFKWYKREALL